MPTQHALLREPQYGRILPRAIHGAPASALEQAGRLRDAAAGLAAESDGARP